MASHDDMIVAERRARASAEVHVHDADRLLTYSEVLRVTGFRSRTTIWSHVRDHSFPAPLRIGRNVVRWRASDISAWMAALPEHHYRQLH